MNDPDQFPETGQWSQDGVSPTESHDQAAPQDAQLPEQIGRYRVEKLLGKGGIGLVYLARDDQLNRRVAIKVPHARRVKEAEAYLTEARAVAGLDHPQIVPVYDVGQSDEFPCYVVSKYAEGETLGARIQRSPISHGEAAEIVATVAEALHHAHTRGLVHRDVSLGNVMLDAEGKPQVLDFGLALKDADVGKGPKFAGTPKHMSPEQARGEGHRVDGRSDIYSLGTVLYELLTGRHTFLADTQAELFELITQQEPKPPRQIDDSTPKELERICLKCLAKRARERYTIALDLADDLRHFLQSHHAASTPRQTGVAAATGSVSTQVPTPTETVQADSDSRPLRIVPKGLLSFDERDADFFLELLPGARDRDGLPDSIRFWKTRIEEFDPDKTFSVGLIYGPSGCGKSSLVKAGLLPRLTDDVISVYVEATPDETETRLLRAVKKACPELDDNLTLTEALTALRRGESLESGSKILIVVDQFEQWLHANKEDKNTELVQALRQCDGEHVQCLVMVRDDFWMAATRFMRDLEIRLLEAHNSAAVDLFPIRHAEKVLMAFGRAFGVVPEDVTMASEAQREFAGQAAAGLAVDGKVICVRLALFAEMMKDKAWEQETLAKVGGIEGVGVTFLEETFSAASAPPEHRLHQKAARAVLKALLPNSGTNIKGHMRSRQELLEASGYGNRPRDFDDLLRILDSEIRLITPTDPEGVGTTDDDEQLTSQAESGQKYYQLTHDYLVHSLRDWLTRKQRETRRGRAELRLAERAALWKAKPENRNLPAWWEYLNIRLLTGKQSWTEPQRQMMRRAGRVHGARWGAATVVLLVVAIAIQQYVASIRHRNLVERTRQAVAAMRVSRGILVPRAIQDLQELPREMVLDELKARFDDSKPSEKLSLAHALANYEEGDLEFLLSSIAEAPSNECANLVTALAHDKDKALKRLAALATEADARSNWQLKGRLAAVALHLGDASLASNVHEDRPDPTQQTAFIHDVFPTWHADLNHLAEVIDAAEDVALRSGMCLALGNLPTDEVRDAKTTWQKLLTRWYAESPDSGTHGAAGWALRQWKVKLPEIAPDQEEPSERRWKVTPHGFTMVRIPAGKFERTDGKTQQTVTLTRDFWLSDVEVSVGLFQQFMDDQSYSGLKPKDWEGVNEGVSPTNQHPAQQVSWEDAVLFCNWLSQKEGRPPCYRVEPIADAKPNDRSTLIVEFLPDGTGYRLPTEAEWEYSCRSGTTTDFGFGDDPEHSNRYAVFSSTKAEVLASKMCNRWGLFDIHGNVWEWCHDWNGEFAGDTASNPRGPVGGSDRVNRGGSWYYNAGYCQSGRRSGNFPWSRSLNGFRVAQVPLPVKKPASGAESDSR